MPAHRHLIAIVLPSGPAGVLAGIRERHALPPWKPAVPFHITLVPPFMAPDDPSARWELVVRRATFPVRIDGFGRFDNPRSSILFAHIAPSESLISLAVAALTAADGLPVPPRPFVPHATLAAPAPRTAVDGWMQRLIVEPLSLEFPCDRFSLLRLDESARVWHSVRDFVFTP